MKPKKPVPVKLFGEEVQVTEVKTGGRMTILNSEGIKDTGYLLEELSVDDRKKLLNRLGLYHYDF